MTSIHDRASDVYYGQGNNASHLRIDGCDSAADIVEYYGPKTKEELMEVVRAAVNLTWLLVDPEAETTDEDAIRAIAGMADILDEAGIKWTSGR